MGISLLNVDSTSLPCTKMHAPTPRRLCNELDGVLSQDYQRCISYAFLIDLDKSSPDGSRLPTVISESQCPRNSTSTILGIWRGRPSPSDRYRSHQT